MSEESQAVETTETAEPTQGTSSEPATIREAVESALSDTSEGSKKEAAAPETDTRETQTEPAKADAPFSWDTVDPRAKTEFETIQKRYRDIQSLNAKRDNEWKTREKTFQEYEAAKKQLDYFNELYQKHPDVQSVLNKVLGVSSQNQVDPDLQNDPLFKYIQEYQTNVQSQIAPLMQHFQKQQEEARQRELDAQVDKATEAAVTKFESLMGRRPTEQEIAKTYQTMVEKRNYDGESAVIATFFDDIKSALVQKALDEQMQKKSVATKTSSVNSGKSKSADEYQKMSMREIIEASLDGTA